MIKVLIVDDSIFMRKVLTEGLSRNPEINVVGSAADPYEAREKILDLNPDVVTLDIEMPRMDGLSFLLKLMKYHPMPVVILSSMTPANSVIAIKALEIGAAEVLCKPSGNTSPSQLQLVLINSIRAAYNSKIFKNDFYSAQNTVTYKGSNAEANPVNPGRVIAIGASTGGTKAIQQLLIQIPSNVPAIVIAQHMPEGFTGPFARRLDEQCRLKVVEASDGEALSPGTAYIAPGNRHLTIEGPKGAPRIRLKDGPRVFHQRPSVDVLFQSVARTAGADAVGVLLTGMGEDGARGLLEMRKASAHTIAQDETTCAVFGMPRVAIGLGAAVEVLPIHKIPESILKAVST